MSIVALSLNLLLAGLLTAALVVGWRLNRRLVVLRESHEGFAKAVADLDAAAQRAEQGLADLRAATDEATDTLGDRIEKARELSRKLERLTTRPPNAEAAAIAEHDLELDRPVDPGRLGALLGAARAAAAATPRRSVVAALAPRAGPNSRSPDEDLFDEPVGRMPISAMLGARQ